MDQRQTILVSCFRSATDTQPKDVSLLRWLEGYAKLNPQVDAIRNETDKEKRSELKRQLPAITPSGTFSRRRADGLIKHSGFIGLDFDNIDPSHVKTILADIVNVYYAGLSVSGRGIWALIPISDPNHHRRHFDALQADFESLGLEVDQACKDVSRLRFYSYDPDPIFNLDAVQYAKLAPRTQYKPIQPRTESGEPLERLIQKIEATGRDITADYLDWVKIGGALASIYGEAGRDLFQRISQFYHKYSPQETDRKYNSCLRNRPGYSENIIFAIAKQYDVLLKN